MYLVDTHAHLYLPQFAEDRAAVIGRAAQSGVKRILLPNIDLASVSGMQDLCSNYPDTCFPMMGLHPCDVKTDFREVLAKMKAMLDVHSYVAIGETGIDLYWDKTTLPQQIESFTEQIHWAIEKSL
ncbi:MAG: TatD family hydrolase, partial [Flavobacteriales bacterium]|nr:TatD family hydrolase [Flavobacteriales bacterium]